MREWYTEWVRWGQFDESTCACNFPKHSIYAEFETKKTSLTVETTYFVTPTYQQFGVCLRRDPGTPDSSNA